MMAKQSVLLIGATGRTGSRATTSLTAVAGVRPSSASKPEVGALKAREVEVCLLDVVGWSVDQIVEPLKGIDIVISTIYFRDIQHQKHLVDACKKTGVKRLVPNDWGTACVRGVRQLHDEKLAVHDYIKEIGLGYTFIDVGWWLVNDLSMYSLEEYIELRYRMQITLPYTETSKSPGIEGPIETFMRSSLKSFYGAGNAKCAVTDRRDIGKFVARILADERTLNQYVFCWTEEVTQTEVFDLAERIAGRKLEKVHVSAEQLAERIQDAKEGIETSDSEYAYSIWIRGDNTVENAKKEEYGSALDARELYPELGKELTFLEAWAREF
ncbi:NAD-binding protein [Fomitiporia mediterranea MF3/22]|uniref:NAD-binding protein n=1 Tax=Fomitiporia mediterranea (strain MF3/22) TaxID=694068 RepID=UPI00044085CC|nr:NAD-binding protein [Fomitiporia mediterranea MF3/22]EJD05565.1 NAD-binding protein [Fomitiporia mediterranea MF3/22]